MVSYYLDQSNELVDGPNYARVDIEDVADGSIRFTLTLLDPLISIASGGTGGDQFGIQRFGFNIAGSGTLNPVTNVSGLPVGWHAELNPNGSIDGFGRFELVSTTTGQHRQSPTLTFYIVGVEGDTPNAYVAYSQGGSSQYFAAHVAGFLDQDPDPYGSLTSALFAGSTLVVPLPAAGWLLLSGFLGFGFITRRKPRARAESPQRTSL
jgi:hypothetical protein